jgi:hypothetical protein
MSSLPTTTSLLVCMSMIACTSREKPVQCTNPSSDEWKGWYVAAQDPRTLCPRGHSLPQDRADVYVGDYVYLPDRKTRFFIPPGQVNLTYRDQALAAREASFTDTERFKRSVASKAAFVGNTVGSLAVMTLVAMGQAGGSGGVATPSNRCKR